MLLVSATFLNPRRFCLQTRAMIPLGSGPFLLFFSKLPWLLMAAVCWTHTTNAVVDAAEFYHHFVQQEDHDSMPALEDEVRLVRGYKEDEEVEVQIGVLFQTLAAPEIEIPSFIKLLSSTGTQRQWWLWVCFPRSGTSDNSSTEWRLLSSRILC